MTRPSQRPIELHFRIAGPPQDSAPQTTGTVRPPGLVASLLMGAIGIALAVVLLVVLFWVVLVLIAIGAVALAAAWLRTSRWYQRLRGVRPRVDQPVVASDQVIDVEVIHSQSRPTRAGG